MKKVFTVADMSCPNCAMHLEGLEDELSGIKSINASYKKQTMEVDFDESKVTLEEIITAAIEIGYHPEPIRRGINNVSRQSPTRGQLLQNRCPGGEELGHPARDGGVLERGAISQPSPLDRCLDHAKVAIGKSFWHCDATTSHD